MSVEVFVRIVEGVGVAARPLADIGARLMVSKVGVIIVVVPVEGCPPLLSQLVEETLLHLL